jgi:hypothetical protein
MEEFANEIPEVEKMYGLSSASAAALAIFILPLTAGLWSSFLSRKVQFANRQVPETMAVNLYRRVQPLGFYRFF